MVQKQKSHDYFSLTQKDTMSTFAAFTRLVPAPNKITKKKKKKKHLFIKIVCLHAIGLI